MSMNTIYVLIRNGELVEVAPSLSSEEALKHFIWAAQGGASGEMYAVRCSDDTAHTIRELTKVGPSLGKATALKIAKTLSYSLTKCADVT